MPPEGLEMLAEWFDGMAAGLPGEAMIALLDHCIEGIEDGAPDALAIFAH